MNYWEKCCFACHQADVEHFNLVTAGLPVGNEQTPSHCGPHSLHAMRFIAALIQPKHLFEIGTNMCHSATLWLCLGVESLLTIDISTRPETAEAVRIMKETCGDRFNFFFRSAFEERASDYQFDTAFIDGGHEHEDVVADINLCRRVGVKWFVFDDWMRCWGPGVQSAIEQEGLVPLAIFGNIALCVEKTYFK